MQDYRSGMMQFPPPISRDRIIGEFPKVHSVSFICARDSRRPLFLPAGSPNGRNASVGRSLYWKRVTSTYLCHITALWVILCYAASLPARLGQRIVLHMKSSQILIKRHLSVYTLYFCSYFYSSDVWVILCDILHVWSVKLWSRFYIQCWNYPWTNWKNWPSLLRYRWLRSHPPV